jgi:hypothetical protein
MADQDMDAYFAKCRTSYRFFNQTKFWAPFDGSPCPIAMIDDRYARNILAFLERRAAHILTQYIWGACYFGPDNDGFASDDWDDQLERLAHADPIAWIRTTPLYDRIAGQRSPTRSYYVNVMGTLLVNHVYE